jgi:pimeloyl-ACP methyl ester carboxylesterase
LTFAGLVLTAALLRLIVYFRDNYRASNYGIPDLIQIIRAIDQEIVKQRHGAGEHHAPHRNVQLSFIGHSMGAFVVTNTIRTLSDVFVTPVEALNAFGAAGPTPAPRLQEIGNVFTLKRFVLASPDIPAEALLSSRGNFLASVLSRFEEAYLFSNEGDEVLRQISTLANYFVFPTKSRNHGFRLGNVEILSRDFGLTNIPRADILKRLRIGHLTLQQLYDAKPPVLLPERFTYFDCTDYTDDWTDWSDANKPIKPARPLLTFANWYKRDDEDARMPWHAHLRLLFVYLFTQQPNVHAGYFQGLLAQQLIYRLACLGYNDTITAYGSEQELGRQCKDSKIRLLVSPELPGPPAAVASSSTPAQVVDVRRTADVQVS